MVIVVLNIEMNNQRLNLEWKMSKTWKSATTLQTPIERLREAAPASWITKITTIGGWGWAMFQSL